MNVVGRVSSFITQGMYSVATPFHPFGGAVDIIVVKQNDGTFRSTPWYVRFGKFQGVLKGAEKVVRIEVNGIEANFHMYLDNSGEAYFLRELDPGKDDDEGFKDSNDIEVVKEDERVHQGGSFNGLPEGCFYGDEVKDASRGRDEQQLVRVESDCSTFYDIPNEQSSIEDSLEFQEYGDSGGYDNLQSVENALESQNATSEVVLVSVDGHILTAPISSSEGKGEFVQLSTPQFHLGPGGGTEEYDRSGATWESETSVVPETYQEDINPANGECSSSQVHVEGDNVAPAQEVQESIQSVCMDISSERQSGHLNKDEESKSSSMPTTDESTSARDSEGQDASSLITGSILESEQQSSVDLPVKMNQSNDNLLSSEDGLNKIEIDKPHLEGLEISLCGNLLRARMGSTAAHAVFEANRISVEEFKQSASTIVKNENLVVRIQGKYLPWVRAAHIILGLAAFNLSLPVEPHDVIPVELAKEEKEGNSALTLTPRRQWRLWPIPFRRVKTLEHTTSSVSTEESFLDAESFPQSQSVSSSSTSYGSSQSPRKQFMRTKVPTTDQIGSLNLIEGQNRVNFVFSTRVLGSQKVEAHIYLWKWNTRIVISDVDGTITKSDVLGQFMPLVGRDWTHSGIARLFSAIKENGYQLLFLSARAIVQAYLTKNFLFNLKQDGKSLPSGPVVISPDGLFPSLYREVIRRAPHEFKIACLEDIKALFPPDYNPFYAGFGNRDTDELSYLKIGIPKGKIFIINPKGEVAINHRIDVKSYTSLHTLVHDMFPPTSMVEQEEYNTWNYWKTPLPEIDL